jgi:hypothetical protein
MSTRSGLTLLGFGKHAAETYENARVRYPSYLSWLRTLSDPSRKQQAWLSYCSHAERANPQTPERGSSKRARVESDELAQTATAARPCDAPELGRSGLPVHFRGWRAMGVLSVCGDWFCFHMRDFNMYTSLRESDTAATILQRPSAGVPSLWRSS